MNFRFKLTQIERWTKDFIACIFCFTRQLYRNFCRVANRNFCSVAYRNFCKYTTEISVRHTTEISVKLTSKAEDTSLYRLIHKSRLEFILIKSIRTQSFCLCHC